MERGRVEFALVARRICWEGLKEGKGGGRGSMVWTLKYVAFARRWGGVGGSVLKIFVCVSVDVHYLLVSCLGHYLAD